MPQCCKHKQNNHLVCISIEKVTQVRASCWHYFSGWTSVSPLQHSTFGSFSLLCALCVTVLTESTAAAAAAATLILQLFEGRLKGGSIFFSSTVLLTGYNSSFIRKTINIRINTTIVSSQIGLRLEETMWGHVYGPVRATDTDFFFFLRISVFDWLTFQT